jgi:hypothetical protein
MIESHPTLYFLTIDIGHLDYDPLESLCHTLSH